ncbi:MAG: ABC transporter permease, partial [Stackebrandtia sp.]
SVLEESRTAEAAKPGRRLLYAELRLMAGRTRNLVGLTILCIVPIVLAIILFVTQPTGGDQGPPFFSVLLGNGLFVVLSTLMMEMTIFLPMAVAILAGDTIAGEANVGTLRYLLTAPVGRTRLLWNKFLSLVIGAGVGVAAVAVTAAIIGVALFGAGDMVTLSGTSTGFGESAGRVALVCLYVVAMLISVCAVGLFASTLTEQPIGAAVGTLMAIILSQILGSLDALSWLHPFLQTTYWANWSGLLRDPIEWGAIGLGLLSAAGYTAVFGTAAWARFTTKDITS